MCTNVYKTNTREPLFSTKELLVQGVTVKEVKYLFATLTVLHLCASEYMFINRNIVVKSKNYSIRTNSFL